MKGKAAVAAEEKMANFILSAFADEYSPMIDEQIVGLKKNGIGYIELRNVDGTNVVDITEEKAYEIKAKFDKAGIRVWSIGSPIGKIAIDDDMGPHLEKLKNVIRVAKILECDKIRMFSFFMPKDRDITDFTDEVMARLEAMLEIAEKEGIQLCHENEKGIYGEKVSPCAEIRDRFAGRIKVIFDPANFIQAGEQTYPYGYSVLGEDIFYMHIKDVVAQSGCVVPAGQGDGHIPEILKELDKRVKGDFVLSIEPHLRVFDGLKELENADDATKIENAYNTAEEAFGAAADAIKSVIANL